MAAIEADDGHAIRDLVHDPVYRELLKGHAPDDEARRTPLMWAYWYGKPLASQALINGGSDYEQQDAAGESAIWYAHRFGNGALAEHLTERISATVRRLSMESKLKPQEGGSAESPNSPSPPPPPARRRPL